MAATLTMLAGKNAGKTVPLPAHAQVVVGRNDDCNLRLRTDLVSRHHCVIEYSAPDWIVRDLGSSNGTFVNGTRVLGPTTVANGDRLSVGPIHFQVSVEIERPVESEEELDADSGVIMGWIAEEDPNASPIKKTTVLTDEQREKIARDLAGATKAPTGGAAAAAAGAVPIEALNALRRMNRGGGK